MADDAYTLQPVDYDPWGAAPQLDWSQFAQPSLAYPEGAPNLPKMLADAPRDVMRGAPGFLFPGITAALTGPPTPPSGYPAMTPNAAGKVPSSDDWRMSPYTAGVVMDIAGLAVPEMKGAGIAAGMAGIGARAGMRAGEDIAEHGPLGFWAHQTPPAPMLLGDPSIRGSMSTLDNVPFTYNGKGPEQWTPEEFKEIGDKFGVPNLGPESAPQQFKYTDGKTFSLPGGLDGAWTYYDLLKMKADGIDPSRIDHDLHIQMQQKLMRTMTPDQPVSPQQIWSGLTFGMTSPNNPLFPNQLTQSILRMRDPAVVDQLAGSIPWKFGDKVSAEDRLEASDKIANMLGIQSGKTGGLGTRGSTDYTRVAELAQLWQKNPEWFRKSPDEPWLNYVERLTSQVPGLSMKTGSFGSVWQNPAEAGISAIDRHMIRRFEQTGQLFRDPAEQADFEARAVGLWNKNNPDRPAQNFAQVTQAPGSESFLTGMKMTHVNDALTPKFRTATGDINPRVPEHLQNANFIVEPSNVSRMGETYGRAIDWNQQLAQQQGLGLFGSQWLEWDRIRRRFEPHENMFPGLERMPAMSIDQLREVSAEHTASGHKTYGKVESDEGQTSLQPTRPRPNPARFAYFTVPPLAAAVTSGQQDQR